LGRAGAGLELLDRRARAAREDEHDPAAALEVDVEEGHQRLVRPGLVGFRVHLIDEADRGAARDRLGEARPEVGLGQLGQVELGVPDLGQRRGDLLHEVRLARAGRRPQQVVVPALRRVGARLGDPQSSILQLLADVRR